MYLRIKSDLIATLRGEDTKIVYKMSPATKNKQKRDNTEQPVDDKLNKSKTIRTTQNRQTDRHTDRQTDTQTDRQTNTD